MSENLQSFDEPFDEAKCELCNVFDEISDDFCCCCCCCCDCCSNTRSCVGRNEIVDDEFRLLTFFTSFESVLSYGNGTKVTETSLMISLSVKK